MFVADQRQHYEERVRAMETGRRGIERKGVGGSGWEAAEDEVLATSVDRTARHNITVLSLEKCMCLQLPRLQITLNRRPNSNV